MRKGRGRSKKKDGWFFSKSLLDEIYQTPIDKDTSTESEKEKALSTQTVETEKSFKEPSSSIAKDPSGIFEQTSTSDVVQTDSLNQIYNDPNHKKEKEQKVFFASTQEHWHSTEKTKKTKIKEESFSLVEEEGKLVYKKDGDIN